MPEIYWYVFWVGLVLILTGLFIWGALATQLHQMEVLKILRSYADKGVEPPPALAEQLAKQVLAPAAGAKAGLASRTNTLLSGPMLMGMLGSKHFFAFGGGSATGFIIALVILVAIEANALFGKTGPMTTVKGVIHCSIALSVVLAALLAYV